MVTGSKWVSEAGAIMRDEAPRALGLALILSLAELFCLVVKRGRFIGWLARTHSWEEFRG